MGFATDVSNQVGQTTDSQGLNPIPGNVVGNMGQPSAGGAGGQAQPIPGNSLGINNPGGTGGGMFGKGSAMNALDPNFGAGMGQAAGGAFGKGGGIGPVKDVMPQTQPSADMAANAIAPIGTPSTMMFKDVMPPAVGQNNLPTPPQGTMAPGQVNRATPAQMMKTRPVISQAPQMRQPPRAGGRFRF
jgi:hypothetical protein